MSGRPRHVIRVGVACAAALFTAVSVLSAGAPPSDTVVIDLSSVPFDSYGQLARLLPEWDEALAAGTRRITISSTEAALLLETGVPVRVVGRSTAPASWPACYTPLAQTEAWARGLAEDRPDLIRLMDVGDSLCKLRGGCNTPDGDRIDGSDLYVLRLSASQSALRGRVWIDGGMHAREIPTTQLMRTVVEFLVAGFGADPQVTYLLLTHELFVGINSNPDGRALVELGATEPHGGAPWSWRKNARLTPGCAWPPASGDHAGVDLNRNHAFHWDAPGHSAAVCDETYRGATPGSEPETDAYEAAIRGIFADRRGPDDGDPAADDTAGVLLNFHNATVPGAVLTPWGWTTDPSPDDAGLAAIAARLARDNGYEVRRSLYPVSGNTRDWGYGELGIPSYVVELEGDTFFTPCEALPRVFGGWIEPVQAALGLSDAAYQRIRGPEAAALEVIPSPDGPQLLARIEAPAGTTTSAAELVIAKPDGSPVPGFAGLDAPAGSGLPMRALDGFYDGRSEVAVMDFAGLALPGGARYLAVVRPASAEAVGLERAAFIDIPVRHVPTKPPPPAVPALLPRVLTR